MRSLTPTPLTLASPVIQLFRNMRTMDASSNAGGEFAPLIQKSSSDSHGGNTRAWWLVASGVACLALAGCAAAAVYGVPLQFSSSAFDSHHGSLRHDGSMHLGVFEYEEDFHDPGVLFEQFDLDGNMKLDFNEFQRGAKRICFFRDKEDISLDEIKRTFSAIDKDGDGLLDVVEAHHSGGLCDFLRFIES